MCSCTFARHCSAYGWSADGTILGAWSLICEKCLHSWISTLLFCHVHGFLFAFLSPNHTHTQTLLHPPKAFSLFFNSLFSHWLIKPIYLYTHQHQGSYFKTVASLYYYLFEYITLYFLACKHIYTKQPIDLKNCDEQHYVTTTFLEL